VIFLNRYRHYTQPLEISTNGDVLGDFVWVLKSLTVLLNRDQSAAEIVMEVAEGANKIVYQLKDSIKSDR
jgi:hypothetical protein